MWKEFSILISLASCSGGAETTKDIERVVDLKIPDQFLPSNWADGQPEKPDKAGDTRENISNLVNLKIPPTIGVIKSNQQIVSNDIVDEPGDIKVETGENISKLVDIKIPSVGIPVPTNNENAKPFDASKSANMPEPGPDVASDKIEPQASQTPIIGDNKNSGGEDINGAVDITVPGDIVNEESEIFLDISAIVDVKIPTLNVIETTSLPKTVTDQENISTSTTRETGRFNCINGITIQIDQVCLFNGLLSLGIPNQT